MDTKKGARRAWTAASVLVLTALVVLGPGGRPVSAYPEFAMAVAARPGDETVQAFVESHAARAVAASRPEAKRKADAGVSLTVRIRRPLAVTSRPGGGRVVGLMPAASKYYHQPIVAWIQRRSANGRFGYVSVPYSAAHAAGWIQLDGLAKSWTGISVKASLSRHELVVRRRGRVILRTPAATGAAVSPTPPGRYFVTDRVPTPPGGYLGAFAFGISGIQTHLPPAWSGGDQLAIHGTNTPSSVGRSVSAGCLRVRAVAVQRLIPLLKLGTPVVIHR